MSGMVGASPGVSDIPEQLERAGLLVVADAIETDITAGRRRAAQATASHSLTLRPAAPPFRPCRATNPGSSTMSTAHISAFGHAEMNGRVEKLHTRAGLWPRASSRGFSPAREG